MNTNAANEILNVEEINKRLGGFGRYQQWIYFLLCFPAMVCAFHKMSKNFLQYEPDYRCQLPYELHNNSETFEYHIINKTITELYQPQKCSYLLHNRTETCQKRYVYDTSMYHSTIVTEWNLVCEDVYYLTLSESLFMAGVMLGSIIFGYLSDRIGRKKCFLYASIIQIVFGFLVAFSPNFLIYLLARFMIALSISGIYPVAFVIALEMVTPKKRQFAGVGLSVSFALGYCLLTLFAYEIRDWRHFQISITVASVFFLSYWWLMPESIRWLVTNKKNDEAKKILKNIAKTNKIDYPIDSIVFENETKEEAKVSLMSLISNRCLRNRILLIFFCWIVNSATYYGLSWNIAGFGSNFFLDYLLSGLVEIPADLSLMFLLNKFGRQFTLCSYMLIAGFSLLLTAFFENEILVLCLTLLGKGTITASYCTVYIFTIEQFPTQIRSTVLGASSTAARIGSILAPQINLLGRFWKPFPSVIFGLAAILSGSMAFALPETNNRRLPDSFNDENLYKDIESDQKTKNANIA